MKVNLIILSGVVLLFSNAFSYGQEPDAKHNSVALAPLSLAAGDYSSLRVRFQHSVCHVAFGTDIKYYFPNRYPGYQVSPYIKLFSLKQKAEGVYLYGTFVFGENKGLPDDKTAYYQCYGFGGGAGYQAAFGKTKCWQFDMALGFKSVTTYSNLSNKDIPEEYLSYYIVGPAAIPDGIISIGYRF